MQCSHKQRVFGVRPPFSLDVLHRLRKHKLYCPLIIITDTANKAACLNPVAWPISRYDKRRMCVSSVSLPQVVLHPSQRLGEGKKFSSVFQLL